jgi:hypothetical protein
MAFFENLVRDTGQPRAPKAPGAPPTPSMPNNKVVSPAPASAPIGRPSNPPTPPPMGGAPGAALPVNGSTPRPSMPSSAPTPRPQAPPNSGIQAPPVAAPAGQPMGASPVIQMERIPSAAERATIPPGVQVQTPYGMMDSDGNITPSPEGAVKYQEAVVARQRQFGPHPFAGDPNAPKPPIALGKRSFNPFTGSWVE